MFGDHQTNSSAFFSTEFLAKTVKGLEELRKLIRSQSCAIVLDTDTDRIRSALAALNDNRASRFVVLDGVGKEVDQNLLKFDSIGFDKAGYF